MVRVRVLLPLPVSLALLAAGCGGGPKADPGAFVQTLLHELEQGRPGAAWETLHPLHQETVPRALYVRCERSAGFGGKLTNLDVLEVKQEDATIPGVFGPKPSTAVTVGVTVAPDGGGAAERFTITAHLFEADGELAWVIGPVDYASYQAGRCPS